MLQKTVVLFVVLFLQPLRQPDASAASRIFFGSLITANSVSASGC